MGVATIERRLIRISYLNNSCRLLSLGIYEYSEERQTEPRLCHAVSRPREMTIYGCLAKRNMACRNRQTRAYTIANSQVGRLGHAQDSHLRWE